MKLKMENLKTIRKERKLTRKQLSVLSGVNVNTIQALEEGLTNIANVKLSTLIALSKALRVKAKRLLPSDLAKGL